MPLLARHCRQSSPSSSALGTEMPGLMKPVASQTVSRKMITTVRIRKKVCVSSDRLSLNSSRMVKKLMRRKLTAKTRSAWEQAYSWARASGTGRPCGSQSSLACSCPEGSRCRFRGISNGTIIASCSFSPIRCSSLVPRLNNIYKAATMRRTTQCQLKCIVGIGWRDCCWAGCLPFALSYINGCRLYLFYWLDR